MTKRWLLGCLLACGSVAAQTYVQVSRPESSQPVYVDLDSIQRDGWNAWAWALFDFSDEGFSEAASKAAMIKGDCEGSRFQVVAQISYAGSMGSGPVVDYTEFDAFDDWDDAPEGSLSANLLQHMCRALPEVEPAAQPQRDASGP